MCQFTAYMKLVRFKIIFRQKCWTDFQPHKVIWPFFFLVITKSSTFKNKSICTPLIERDKSSLTPMRSYTLLLFLVLFVSTVFAQNPNYKMGERALINGDFKAAVSSLEKALAAPDWTAAAWAGMHGMGLTPAPGSAPARRRQTVPPAAARSTSAATMSKRFGTKARGGDSGRQGLCGQ